MHDTSWLGKNTRGDKGNASRPDSIQWQITLRSFTSSSARKVCSAFRLWTHETFVRRSQ